MSKIIDIKAREILDSRGNPTVEVDVYLDKNVMARASVPSGASTGTFEAVELRDNDVKRYLGKGVLKAVDNINEKISKNLIGLDSTNQINIDKILIELDGTENKSKLGANAILGVSIAIARASAKYFNMPLYRYIGGVNSKEMPVPMMNILNGGKHADNNIDFQEFMIVPIGGVNFSHSLQMSSEVYHNLGKILNKNSVGDEGGFAPNLKSNEEALKYICEAIEKSKYKIGKDFKIALDIASNELYNFKTKRYELNGECKKLNFNEMLEYYVYLVEKYPIISIEDGFSENEWDQWIELTKLLGKKVQIVGDDLFVTNIKRLNKGINLNAANSILIKMNQIGTLTETLDAIEMAKKAGFSTVISHRSGETEDNMISDIAVATNSGQIKTGAPCRSDRVSKYNQLIRIEQELNNMSLYKGNKIFYNKN